MSFDGGVDAGPGCRTLAFTMYVSSPLLDPAEGVAIADLDHLGPAELLLSVEAPDGSFIRTTHVSDGGLVITGGTVSSFAVPDAVIGRRALTSDTRSLLVTDEDHDSWSDVITESAEGVDVLLNRSGAGRRLVPWTVGLGPVRGVAIAPYSGEGPDLAELIVGSGSSSLVLSANDGAGGLSYIAQAFFTGVGSRVLGGRRNDRDGGFFVAATQSGLACEARDGVSPFPRLSTRSLGSDVHALGIGAIGSDGGVAVVVAFAGGVPGGGDIIASIDVGSADVAAGPLVSLGGTSAAAHAVVVSDVDGDGVADLVVATDVGVTVIRARPPQGVPATLELTTPVPALELAVGDLDGDGRPEIVAVSHFVVVVWTNACTP